MKRLKINKAWWAVLLVVFGAFLPLLSLAIPEKAAAIAGYQYTDGSATTITGSDPLKNSDTLTFKKTSDAKYLSNAGENPGDDYCNGNGVTYVIQLDSKKYDASSAGKLYRFCVGSDLKLLGSVTISKSAQGIKNGYWVDHSHITVGGDAGGTFVDGKIDDTVTFKITGSADSCQQQGSIDGFPHSGSGGDGKNTANASATVKLHSFKQSSTTGNSSCIQTDYNLKMNDPQHAYNRYFTWQDSGTITTSDESRMVFQLAQGTTGKGNFLGSSSGTCKSYITADPANPNSGKLIIQTSGSNPFQTGFPDGKDGDTSGQHIGDAKLTQSGSCKVSKPISIYLANPKDPKTNKLSSTLEAGTASFGDSGGGGDTSAPALKCDFGLGDGILSGAAHLFNPLNWLLCGIVKGLSLIVDTLDTAINSELSVGTDGTGTSTEPTNIFTSDNGTCTSGNACDAYYSAWASFRNIALGLMVIAVLVVITAQVIGMEILDAYTIRKVLPRLLIAALGITLSWQLMRFFVTLTNDLGYGIRYLIYHPFATAGFDEIRIKGLGGGNGVGLGIIAGIGLGFFDFFGILTFAATAALAVFVAFLTLVLRQILITMLIILAPIAIVAYILPNTQRVYKVWWESFSKALFMFPIIVAMIASGRVFAMLALTGPNGQNLLNQIIAFVAYFAPYMMIPLTFKLAGTAMGGMGNFINSRAQPAFGALSKRRSEGGAKKRAAMNERFQQGDFQNFIPEKMTRTRKGYGKVLGATNNVGRRFGGGIIRGGFGFGARGQTARERLLAEAAAREEKNNPAMHEVEKINAAGRLFALTSKHRGDVAAATKELEEHYRSGKNEYNKKFEGEELEEKVAEAKGLMANAGGWTPGRAVAAVRGMARDGTAIRDFEDEAMLAAWVSEGSESMTYNTLSEMAAISGQKNRGELAPSQDKKAAAASAATRKFLDENGISDTKFTQVMDEATMSGAGGQTAADAVARSPERVVRANTEHGMDIVKRYLAEGEDVKYGRMTEAERTVSFDTAAQAAAVVRDLQVAAEQGGQYGKTDLKLAINKAMSTDGRQVALDRFMGQSTPISAEGVKVAGQPANAGGIPAAGPAKPVATESVNAYVSRLSTGARGGMPPEEARQAMLRGDEQAAQQQQPPPEQQ
jgi:hypothetical protein